MRGLPLALVVLGQLLVAGIGVAAGLALLGSRRGAATFAKWSLAPVRRRWICSSTRRRSCRTIGCPGTTPLFVVASLAYYAIWLAYLSRSKRVRNTFRCSS